MIKHVKANLSILDALRDMKSSTMRDEMITVNLDDPEMIFIFNMMASRVLKKPQVVYNLFTNNTPMEDIVNYFHTGKIQGIPKQTLRLIRYMSDPGEIRMNVLDIYRILEDTDNLIDVYEYLGQPESYGCPICGDVTDGNVCDYCSSTMESFTHFRSDEHFHVELCNENFKRPLVIKPTENVQLEFKHYTMSSYGNEFLYVRNNTPFQAQLPFREYQMFDGF